MSDIVERAEERLSVSRLGKSSHRETDKDLVVIADLLAEVKRLTPREITSAEELDALHDVIGEAVREYLNEADEGFSYDTIAEVALIALAAAGWEIVKLPMRKDNTNDRTR